MKIAIRAIADKRMLCLYAALNATGYNFENHPPMHSIRMLVREYLEQQNLELKELKRLFDKYSNNHYYCFRFWALHHGEPPTFPEISSAWQDVLPKDIKEVGKLLGNFWAEAKLENIWEQVLPTYQQAVVQLKAIGQEAVNKVVNYFRTNKLDIKEFVVIPNFLDSHYIGLGPQIGDTAVAILGPDFDNFTLTKVMHEFLHSIINPLTESVPDAQKRSKLREYWIRAIVIRASDLSEEKYIQKRQIVIDRGYTNIDYFLGKLAEFEKGEKDFLQYFKEFPHQLAISDYC
ncbi:DUF4932 domain-containing protein [Patescibacteria group bacterium]|nr:DUF4932 domain-containing protein [Patescibacteria group bacterium]